MSVDRVSADRRSVPRRVHARPTGAPTGTFPRQLFRIAQTSLFAGVILATAVAVLPAPPASEEFQVAFSDWRRSGAWYVGEEGGPGFAPGVPGAVPEEADPFTPGPIMVADAADAPTGDLPTASPGRRMAALTSGAGGRRSDFTPAPLAATRRAIAGETPEDRADVARRRLAAGALPGNVGPSVPPPSFADVPFDDVPFADVPFDDSPFDVSPFDDLTVEDVRDVIRGDADPSLTAARTASPAPADGAASMPEPPERPGALQEANDGLLEELRGLREDVRGLSARWERVESMLGPLSPALGSVEPRDDLRD